MLGTLSQGLIKNTKYEKYIKFFTSFLIMLSLLKPVIDFGQNKDTLDAAFLKNVFQNELSVISGSKELSEMNKNILEEYDIAYKNQIKLFAGNAGLTVLSIEITWNESETALKGCKIVVEKMQDTAVNSKIEYLKRKLKEVYNLEQDNIDISIEE